MTGVHLLFGYLIIQLGSSRGSAGKESACNAGDLGSILGLGRSLGEGKGYPLQYSGLENSRDCIVHGVSESHPVSLEKILLLLLLYFQNNEFAHGNPLKVTK